MLAVHPSGFYAWLREPFSQRALEDQRQTVLLKQAWDDSGEVYGYRKLHDDLCDMGCDISPNRAWRLARLAGIRAQIGYKKKPGSFGGSPEVTPVISAGAAATAFSANSGERACPLRGASTTDPSAPASRYHNQPGGWPSGLQGAAGVHRLRSKTTPKAVSGG